MAFKMGPWTFYSKIHGQNYEITCHLKVCKLLYLPFSLNVLWMCLCYVLYVCVWFQLKWNRCSNFGHILTHAHTHTRWYIHIKWVFEFLGLVVFVIACVFSVCGGLFVFVSIRLMTRLCSVCMFIMRLNVWVNVDDVYAYSFVFFWLFCFGLSFCFQRETHE